MAFTVDDISGDSMAIVKKFSLPLTSIVSIMNQLAGLDKTGAISFKRNIVVGLDVNGPMVDTADNTLTPYPGCKEALDLLMRARGVSVSLMTGWDLATMLYYREKKLDVPVGIVCEYGMVYYLNNRVSYLYPLNENESFEFMSKAFDLMVKENVKAAFQGNYSAGVGSLVVEGDQHGDLLLHPMVKGRRPTMEQLSAAAEHESEIEFNKKTNLIIFKNTPSNMKGLHNALTRQHPLVSVRAKAMGHGKIGIWIDDKDQPDFDMEKIKAFAHVAAQATGRIPQWHRDHGVDLHSPKAKEGNYSKESGLHAYAKEVFGSEDFFSCVVGDMQNDIPSVYGNTVFFAVAGSEAEEIVKRQGKPLMVSITDVRDFALALYELYIKKFN